MRPTELDKHLAHLRGDQAAKRTQIYDLVELKELRACRNLAYDLFGSDGVVEFPTDPVTNFRIGPIRISVFLEKLNPRHPKQLRKTKPMFQGASFAELFEQAALWRSKRG